VSDQRREVYLDVVARDGNDDARILAGSGKLAGECGQEHVRAAFDAADMPSEVQVRTVLVRL
jgi:hypothetical protein